MESEMLSRVLRSEPTFEIQLVCVALLSAVVYVFLLLCNEIVSRLTKDKEYIPTVIQVGKHKLKGMLGVDASDELSLQFWVEMWGICIQHAVGGALCLPALIPSAFPSVSHSLALSLTRWGALSEVAFEVTDSLKRIYQRCFLDNGAELQPNALLFLLFCHHSLSTLLVVPTNVLYSEFDVNDTRTASKYRIAYPEMVFSMQAAAAFAVLIQQYTQALDIKKSSASLTKMFYLSLVSLIVMAYTRGIHYWWCVYRLLYIVRDEGHTAMLVPVSIIMLVLFPLLGFVFIGDGLKRTIKYGKLYWSLITSPKDADPAARNRDMLLMRTMTLQLQIATSSAISPLYVPSTKQWSKLRAAVMVSTLHATSKKKK